MAPRRYFPCSTTLLTDVLPHIKLRGLIYSAVNHRENSSNSNGDWIVTVTSIGYIPPSLRLSAIPLLVYWPRASAVDGNVLNASVMWVTSGFVPWMMIERELERRTVKRKTGLYGDIGPKLCPVLCTNNNLRERLFKAISAI